MTMTRPTMENAHVQPDAAGMPTAVSTVCQPTMMEATTYSSGWSRVKNQSNMRVLAVRRRAGAADGRRRMPPVWS